MENDNQAIVERVKQLIERDGLTQREFAERIGINASNLSKHLTGKLPISDALLNKIVVNLGVDKQWLLNGGEQTDIVPTTITATPTSTGTPIYDIDVTAGPSPRAMMFSNENLIGFIDIPSVAQDSRIVQVSGDSMKPVISNGDFIAVKEVNDDIILWGQIYVVLLDDLRVVKYLRRHKDSSLVVLRSANPEYDDIEIPRTSIRRLFLVRNIIHIENRI